MVTCSWCDGPTYPLGSLGRVHYYRCRNCGADTRVQPKHIRLPNGKTIIEEPTELERRYGGRLGR